MYTYYMYTCEGTQGGDRAGGLRLWSSLSRSFDALIYEFPEFKELEGAEEFLGLLGSRPFSMGGGEGTGLYLGLRTHMGIDKILTLIETRVFSPTAEILEVFTCPSQRRQGYMEETLGLLMERLRVWNGVSEIWLEVHENNAPALNLYRKKKFYEVGRRPRYYPDGGTAILMTAMLEEG